jgi:DegV family protein with EDD domain
MRDYVIVTDAACDLPVEVLNENSIDVIGMELLIGSDSYTHYPDYRELSIENFYQELRANKMPKTTQIATGKYIEFFSKFAKEKKNILYICLSSGLSATFQSANLAKTMVLEEYPKCRIYILDTKTASLGEGYLAILAAINKNKMMNIEENYNDIEKLKYNILANFTVSDLMYLFNGGRLSKTSALLGTALKIKPLLQINSDGKLVSFAKVRTRRMSIKKLVEILDETIINIPNQNIFILHSNCFEESRKLHDIVKEKYPSIKITISYLGPVIASHTGEGLIGLIYAGKSRKL